MISCGAMGGVLKGHSEGGGAFGGVGRVPLAVGDGLGAEAGGVGRALDVGLQLLLATQDFLLLNLDLLATLHDQNLHLFALNILLDLGLLCDKKEGRTQRGGGRIRGRGRRRAGHCQCPSARARTC